MPAERNRRNALRRIEALRLQDAVAVARKLSLPATPVSWLKLSDPRGIDQAGFEVSLNTLDRTYESRNRCIGPHRPGIHGDEAFKALERIMARDGPLPKPGLRAALWQGMDFDDD